MELPPTFKRHKHTEPEDEGWLITFADMCVLLMSFFIIMFALASKNPQELAKVAKGLYEKGFHNDNIPLDPTEALKKNITLAIGNQGYDQFIAASETKHGVDMELASGAFFEPGSAKFSAKAIPMLQMITAEILPIANQDIMVEIEGHTDDTPPPAGYPSNWELSAARAANVVRYLIAQKFPASKLRAVGVANTQPKAPDRDEAGNPIPANQDLNRRVVIKLIRGEDN